MYMCLIKNVFSENIEESYKTESLMPSLNLLVLADAKEINYRLK